MSAQYLKLDADFLKSAIAKLIEANPELGEDDALRADMLEAETDLHRVIERCLDEKLDADEMAEAIGSRIDALKARAGRFERKSEAMKSLIKSVMQAADLPKLILPEATLSIRAPMASVNVLNVDDLPQGYFKTERKADKTAIKSALMQGDEIPGAELALGDESLSIRLK